MYNVHVHISTTCIIEIPMYYSIEYSIWPSNFKNSILIGIRSKFLGNISTCICIRKCNKKGQFSLMKFGQRPCTIVYGDFGLVLEQIQKFIKYPFLIGISSNFLHNIHVSACICIRKIIKMEKSLLAIYDEIWPKTLYYSTGTLAQFLSNFKNS